MTARLSAEGLVVPLPPVGSSEVRCASFAAPAGRVTTIRGASGSGKTTVLRALAALAPHTAGVIRLDGVDVATLSPMVYRRRVAFVAQGAPMLAGSVADNLLAGPRLAGTTLPAARLAELLAAVNLTPDFLPREAASLSGGEKQRVAFARALANAPGALLLDEPTSALDPAAAEHVLATIERLSREEGLAVVLVSHRHGDVARFAAGNAAAADDACAYEAAAGVITRVADLASATSAGG